MKKVDVIADKLIHVFFVIFIIFTIFLFYYFGYNVNTVKYNSSIMLADRFIKNSDIVHLAIRGDDKRGFAYDEPQKTCNSLTNSKARLHPYFGISKKTLFEFQGYSSHTALRSTTVYSDYEYTEILNLPLYDDNSPIRTGPKYEADFASYIPSSLADKLLASFGLNSYSELLAQEKLFTLTYGESVYSFSINNIYLNNNSTHWEKEVETDDKYYQTFPLWNEETIFSYSPRIYKEYLDSTIFFDIEPTYGHLDKILRQVFKYSNSTTINIEIEKTNHETYKFSLNKSDSKFSFGGKSQIVILISLISMIVSLTTLIIFAKDVRQNMFKYFKYILIFVIPFIITGEIVKSVVVTAAWPFLIFNYFGNICTFLFLLQFCIVALLFEKEPKDETVDSEQH